MQSAITNALQVAMEMIRFKNKKGLALNQPLFIQATYCAT